MVQNTVLWQGISQRIHQGLQLRTAGTGYLDADGATFISFPIFPCSSMTTLIFKRTVTPELKVWRMSVNKFAW